MKHPIMISGNAVAWLANGERGVSSETIFQHLTGVKALRRFEPGIPHDPADVRRCRLLLDDCPELAERFEEMRTCSPAWARFVDAWPEICKLMDTESPAWRTIPSLAPRTYALVKRVRDGK